ncbi:MAG: MATE family efflux transporter, partial [Eubacterium sp.]|nr:MATE family efflux transporter [Eubacterium sp.]
MISLFNDKSFWKTAIRLAIPVALQNLLTSSFTLADTLLVSNLGTVALSSVGMMGQWSWLMNMILVGFCSATTVFISQFWGVKDLKKIRHIGGISILFALIVAVIFTVISLVIPNGVVRIFNSDEAVIATGAQYLKIVAFSFIPIALTNIL